MPDIRPISDLRNSANEISDFCRATREPVYITKNGTGDMVILNMQEHERLMAQIDLYAKLGEAETEAAKGETGVDFDAFARKLRNQVHGKV
jgi:prevent-host-death family protein